MTGEYLLIYKRKGQKTEVKITRKTRNSYAPDSHSRVVNLGDYKNLVLFLHDLEDLYSVKVDQAVRQYLDEKKSNWPF